MGAERGTTRGAASRNGRVMRERRRRRKSLTVVNLEEVAKSIMSGLFFKKKSPVPRTIMSARWQEYVSDTYRNASAPA